MKGAELAYAYYKEYGEPLLWSCFPRYADRIACGLVGEGSECFGFDDELSRDHDFGAGFCLWLSDEDERAIGADLRQRYASLPVSYRGFPKRALYVSGSQRTGVFRITDFYRRYLGCDGVPQTLEQWQRIPESFLATATNGQVFVDHAGQFSAIRSALLNFYPEDLRRKKLAARLAVMAQAGQYNYPRSLQRGEKVAALLAVSEFVRAACSAIYLLNRRYMPFYKWAHRGLLELPRLSEAAGLLDAVADRSLAAGAAIEEICRRLGAELLSQGLVTRSCDFLIELTGEIIAGITDERLRHENVFADA